METLELDLEIGDVILTGKFKNKRSTVKEMGVDDNGQPTINGKSVLKFRIEKHMPKDKWSSKSKELLEKGELNEGKMRRTKSQLRRIVRKIITEQVSPGLQSGGAVNTWDQLEALTPGDRLTMNGAPITFLDVSTVDGYLTYVDTGKTIRKHFDARMSVLYPGDPPDMSLEVMLVYQGPGEPPKRTRLPTRKKGPGHSYSIYD